MKLGLLAVGLVSVLAAGCHSTREVRNVHTLGVVDALPGVDNPGYVEFMSVSKDVPIPIYQLDSENRAYPLAAIGLDSGDRYDANRTRLEVLERLRVAEPSGTQTFMVENDGQRFQVPVEPGKITPVEIDYKLVERGDVFRTYRVDYRVFDPVPYQKEKLGHLSAKQ
jgi:hypothetical protein